MYVERSDENPPQLIGRTSVLCNGAYAMAEASLILKWPHFSLQNILFFTVCQYSVLRAWRCSLRGVADLFRRKFHCIVCRAQNFREIGRTRLGKCARSEERGPLAFSIRRKCRRCRHCRRRRRAKPIALYRIDTYL